MAAALAAHGLVMNGGVEHTLGILTEAQLLAAIQGFRYFGMNAAARVFETALAARGIDSNVHDRSYWEAVPNDEAIVRAFESKYQSSPNAFAPVDAQSHA
ncbi:MAG TPA: hypothetical protein VHB46_06170 [Burkholderiales bacterium]|nr:hypothetical protein [Burkholderiales bacterium]